VKRDMTQPVLVTSNSSREALQRRDELRSFTARDSYSRVAVDRALARMDTLVGRTTAGQGTIGQAMRDPSLYANADSLLIELRALVADFKANPRRYVNVRIF
jgi:hypothetical protein